jgi:hypothetical protein
MFIYFLINATLQMIADSFIQHISYRMFWLKFRPLSGSAAIIQKERTDTEASA